MDIVALVALTVAATQIVKKLIEKILGHDLAPIIGTALAVIVAVVEVAWKAIQIGAPFDGALLGILIQVIIGAVGGFKVAKALLATVANGK